MAPLLVKNLRHELNRMSRSRHLLSGKVAVRMAEARNRLLDEFLVAAANAGDRRAFELLVRRWHNKLVAHASRLLGDTERAKDAAQESWVEIVRGLGKLQDERAFPAWAYRIVSRRCARQIGILRRARALNEAVVAQPESLPAESEPTDQSALKRLRAAVGALPQEQRAAVALFYFEDMSVAEVAVALDVPAGTVKTRLMHARRKLRAALEGEA
ncbi:MAG: sigma-70 family RNA polymerase sigma factor [Parvularculaceae bacterium]